MLASVYSLEDQCDDIQDIMAVELSPVKTFIDDQAVKFEKKINSKLYDAVSGLVTCNDTLSTYLNCFLKTNNVESLKNFSNTFKVTVDSTYEKIRANFTQAMVAKRTTAFNTKLYETIQQVVQIKTKELKDLIAVKTGNRTCFVEVFKTTFKILTNKFISNIGDFLIDSRDQKISDKLVKYIINLNKWCDEIPKEVNHCKETTFMTCCIDAYVSKVQLTQINH